jgi:small membrane protein
MISQYLLSLVLIGICIYFATARAGSRVGRFFICGVILVGVALVWQPESSNVIARSVGISRGADLLFYLWVIISLFFIGRLRLEVWRQSREITSMVRAIALLGPQKAKEEDQGQ